MKTACELEEDVREALDPVARALGVETWTLDLHVEPHGGASARIAGLWPGPTSPVIVASAAALPAACVRVAFDRLNGACHTATAVAIEAVRRAAHWRRARAALGLHDWRFTVALGQYAVVEARCVRCALWRERRRVDGEGDEILFVESYSADGARWVCPASVPPCAPAAHGSAP